MNVRAARITLCATSFSPSPLGGRWKRVLAQPPNMFCQYRSSDNDSSAGTLGRARPYTFTFFIGRGPASELSKSWRIQTIQS